MGTPPTTKPTTLMLFITGDNLKFKPQLFKDNLEFKPRLLKGVLCEKLNLMLRHNTLTSIVKLILMPTLDSVTLLPTIKLSPAPPMPTPTTHSTILGLTIIMLTLLIPTCILDIPTLPTTMVESTNIRSSSNEST